MGRNYAISKKLMMYSTLYRNISSPECFDLELRRIQNKDRLEPILQNSKIFVKEGPTGPCLASMVSQFLLKNKTNLKILVGSSISNMTL